MNLVQTKYTHFWLQYSKDSHVLGWVCFFLTVWYGCFLELFRTYQRYTILHYRHIYTKERSRNSWLAFYDLSYCIMLVLKVTQKHQQMTSLTLAIRIILSKYPKTFVHIILRMTWHELCPLSKSSINVNQNSPEISLIEKVVCDGLINLFHPLNHRILMTQVLSSMCITVTKGGEVSGSEKISPFLSSKTFRTSSVALYSFTHRQVTEWRALRGTFRWCFIYIPHIILGL